jgi:SAM-dependent methyltransferase
MSHSGDQRRESQRRVYGDLHQRYGDDARALLHSGQDSQFERFAILARCFARASKPFTVHEIGCGLGHLGAYLQQCFPDAIFSGSDIYQPFVDACRERFPQGEFFLRDISEGLPDDRYDFVVVAGTFNIPGSTPRSEWQSFTYSMLRAMYALAHKGIGVTFLTGYSDPGRERPDMFYQDEKEIVDFAKRNLSRHLEIDGFGPLYEYGLRVYRPEYVRALHPQDSFARYFKSLDRSDGPDR